MDGISRFFKFSIVKKDYDAGLNKKLIYIMVE